MFVFSLSTPTGPIVKPTDVLPPVEFNSPLAEYV